MSTEALFTGIDFDGMQSKLEGRTKQVVSKSELAATLRKHNELLASLVKEVSSSHSRIESLESALADAQETIAEQGNWIERLKETLTWKSRIEGLERSADKLQTCTDDHEKRVSKIEVQNEDWDRLKTGALPLRATQVMVDRGDLPETSLDQELQATWGRVNLVTDKMKSVEATMADLSNLAHRFDRLDQLGRTTADTQARLLGILKKVGIDPSSPEGGSGGLVELKEQMEAYTKEFDTIKSDVDKFRQQLVEKADMVKVEARIERKYEEITAYLHEAIQAANDDEMEFRTVAGTLQTTVKELMQSKADRSDLLEMHGSRFGDASSASQLKTMQAMLADKLDAGEVEALVAARLEEALQVHRPVTADTKDSAPLPPTSADVSRMTTPSRPARPEESPLPSRRVSHTSTLRPRTGATIEPIDRDILMADVKRLVELTLENMTPEAQQGWALKGAVPAPLDPLACISCNTPLPTKPAPLPHAKNTTRTVNLDYTADMGVTRNSNFAATAATMGPGGSSLGGGFNVRVPDSRARRSSSRQGTASGQRLKLKSSAAPLTSFPDSTPLPPAPAPAPAPAASPPPAVPETVESKLDDDVYLADGWKEVDGETMTQSQLALQGSLASAEDLPTGDLPAEG